MKKHIIWSDLNFDYERDWEDAMMEMYPDCSELERRAIAMQENADNLEYAREDLNIDLKTPILVLAVLSGRPRSSATSFSLYPCTYFSTHASR